ncbi:MAG TPA: hypothetical protein DEP72_08580 [Clostridiales bacterium]|nr:MAG: hypothetical protein A2Y18_07235 [Clostridiales bacterium GWD2_32_19]HCC08193.1 hypothetical protein [Clostridiales bacterium]
MEISNNLICPSCNNNDFIGKYEALYVYSYFIDSNAPGLKNDENFYSFLYDKRELKGRKQYVECCNCGAQYPCDFTEGNKGVNSNTLKNIVNSNSTHKETVKL